MKSGLEIENERLRGELEWFKTQNERLTTACPGTGGEQLRWTQESHMSALRQLRTMTEEMDKLKAEKEVLLQMSVKDDPALDGTHAAHPAWWRGYNAREETEKALRSMKATLEPPVSPTPR